MRHQKVVLLVLNYYIIARLVIVGVVVMKLNTILSLPLTYFRLI
jgi:hypothetical protein